MHGRLKIKTTAEQEAEKKKEREVKQRIYLAGIKAVFSKRNEGIYDKEALGITGQLLSANPDVSTLWNFRREIIIAFKEKVSVEDFQDLLEEELKTTEFCLIKNPKSYGAWHHRDWVFGVIPSPPFEEELELCDRYLQKDERNFHVWDHRRSIVNRSSRSLTEELTLTQNLIEKNFSNYSAWHYRSKLLPLLFPPPEGCPHPIPEEIFLKELKKVVAAVFTDPSDQSPWFFLRWLLGRKEEEQRLLQIGVLPSKDEVRLVLIFANAVHTCAGFILHINDEEFSTQKLTAHHNRCIWTAPLCLDGPRFKIRLKLKPSSEEVCLEFENIAEPSFKWVSNDVFGNRKLSAKARSVLVEIKDNCVMLDQLDTGNKWVLLTLVNIMSVLDPTKYQKDVLGYLDQLEDIDPLRVNYYRDHRSRLLLEEKMESLVSKENKKHFNAPCLNLSRVVSPQILCHVERIDLRGNSLKCLNFAKSFLNCSQLILDGNPVHDLSPLVYLERLKELSLISCGIRAFESLTCLKNCSLLSLSVENNDVTKVDSFESRLLGLIESLQKLGC